MYSYKILLADDESEILQGLSGFLENECENIEIVARCTNGDQAIQYLEKNPVDIVISDISMPVVTGTEIAKYIKEHKPDTHVILITGYRKFEYASDAIKYGVSTFITKPIDFVELLNAVDQAQRALADKLSAAVQVTQSILRDRDARRMHLLMLTAGLYDGVDSSDLFDANINDLPCALTEFESNTEFEDAAEKDDVWQSMCELDDDEKNVFCLHENSCGATLLILFKLSDYAQMSKIAEQYAEGIKRLMQSAYKIKAQYKISYFNRIRDVSTRNFDSLAGLYVDYLSKNNFVAKADFLNIIHSSFNYDMLKNFLFIVLRLVQGLGIKTEQIYSDVSAARTKQDLLKVISDIDRVVKQDADNSNDRIVSIKNYISNHFNSNLSLLSVAEAFHLNPSYLSRIFKNATDMRIGDYIMDVRMEKAKQLLSNKSYNISEVASMIGYNNSAYFSKIFKDYTGVTPAQYQSFGEESINADKTKGK